MKKVQELNPEDRTALNQYGNKRYDDGKIAGFEEAGLSTEQSVAEKIKATEDWSNHIKHNLTPEDRKLAQKAVQAVSKEDWTAIHEHAQRLYKEGVAYGELSCSK